MTASLSDTFSFSAITALHSPLWWLGLIASIFLLVLGFSRKRSRGEWGFVDAVKDAGWWERADKAHERAEAAVEAARSWDDGKVAAAAKAFIFDVASSREAWVEKRVLLGLGERPQPAVLQIFKDSSLYQRLVKPTGEDLLPEAPFNRACVLLGDAPPPEAVALTAPFLNDASEEIRKDAALIIGKSGTSSIVPHIRKALADSDEYVRAYALMGLQFALERGGLAQAAAEQLFPDVERLLEEGKNENEAADVLFRFDAQRAKELFISPSVFSAEFPSLHGVLKTLAKDKVAVPVEQLRDLIRALEETEPNNPGPLGEALQLLSQLQAPEDRDFLRARMRLPDKGGSRKDGTFHAQRRVARCAAAGLLCSYGLDGFERRVLDAEKRLGYASLPEHQRLFSAVFECDAEINNGGFAQYFVNSSGDNWKDAVAGLEAMGLVERLALVRKAIAAFGEAGPPEERRTRQKRLSKLYRRNDKIFEGLESRYFASTEVVEVFFTNFVLAHPESFR